MSAYIKSIADVPQVDLNNLPRFKTNIPELDKCIGGLLFGTVTILTGKRGNGKSTFMSQLICEAIDQGVKTFVYSGELADFHFKGWIDLQLAGKENLESVQDEFGNTLYSIPAAITAKINEWYRERLYLYDKRYVPADGEYETLEAVIKDAVDEYGVRFVCIDNLMTAMETVSNVNELNLAQSRFVGMLADIAKTRDVAILLVSHPKKGDSDDLNDWVSGSSDITNKADVVMTYKRVEDQNHDGELQISKSRFYGRYALGKNAIKLTYSEATKRIASYEYGTKRRYGWQGDFSELDPDSDDAVIDLPF